MVVLRRERTLQGEVTCGCMKRYIANYLEELTMAEAKAIFPGIGWNGTRTKAMGFDRENRLVLVTVYDTAWYWAPNLDGTCGSWLPYYSFYDDWH